jgi:leucyl-tRNA synthetase
VRDRLEVPIDLPDSELVEHALASPRVQTLLDGGEIRRTVVVPQKLVNLVIS